MNTENTWHQLWVSVTDSDETIVEGLWMLWYNGETCKFITNGDLEGKKWTNDLVVLDKEASWQSVDVVMKYILKSVSKKSNGYRLWLMESLETHIFQKNLKLLTELFYYPGLKLYDFWRLKKSSAPTFSRAESRLGKLLYWKDIVSLILFRCG